MSAGNRPSGRNIYHLITNLLNEGKIVKVNMRSVTAVTSSFADELFGRLYVDLGEAGFTQRIQIDQPNRFCRAIIDHAIYERLQNGGT